MATKKAEREDMEREDEQGPEAEVESKGRAVTAGAVTAGAVTAGAVTAEGALPMPADVFPDFAVSLEEAGRRIAMLKQFVREHMVEGEDYGVIPGASPKPTLFKPGAEKLNAIFGLAPVVEITNRVEDWDAGFAAYEIKVILINKRSGGVEAEGIGNCNSRERRYKNQDAANIANTLLKMAKKRALIDATLSATRASGMFTQDLEDMDFSERNGSSSREPSRERAEPSRERAEPSRERAEPSREKSNGFVPAARAREEREADGRDSEGGNLLSEAQYGAILAIGNKVYGRSAREEVAKEAGKPIANLSKGEASALIDRLRAMGG